MKSKIYIFIFTLLFLSACGVETTVTKVKSTSSSIINKTTKPVTCFELNDSETQIRDFINSSNFDKALKIYMDKKEHLNKCSEDPQKIVVDLADSINAFYGFKFNNFTNKILSLENNKNNWSQFKSIKLDTRKLLKEYKSENFFYAFPKYLNNDYLVLENRINRLEDFYKQNLESFFINHNHFDKNFFEKYPIEVNKKNTLFQSNFDNFTKDFKIQPINLSEKFLKRNFLYFDKKQQELFNELYDNKFYAKYNIDLKSNDIKSIINFNKVVQNNYPNYLKKPDLLNFSTTKYLINNEKSNSNLVLKSDDNFFGSKLVKNSKDFDFEIRNDESKFILVLNSKNDKFSSSLSKKLSKTSKYLHEIQFLDNPKYYAAQNNYIDRQNRYNIAKSEYNQCISQYCGDYCWLTYSACLATLAIHDSAASSALDTLNRTSPTIEKEILMPYNYTTTEVLSKKEIQLDIYLINNLNKTFQTRTLTLEKDKTHKFVYDLDPRDKDYDKIVKSYDSDGDIENWKNKPFNISIKNILKKLENEPSQDIAKLKIIKKESVKKIDTQKKTQTFTGSVVKIITPNGSFGSGFYIKNNIILTNYHVIEGNNLVEIKNDRGEVFQGEVINFDISRDIASIRTNKLNEVVEIHKGSINIGEDVIAVGHPQGFEFTVTKGIISSIRNEKFNEYDISSTKYIQTDAPINPGNSGGPLFYNKKLIGMNTMGVSKDISEGLNFALHIDEILDFVN